MSDSQPNFQSSKNSPTGAFTALGDVFAEGKQQLQRQAKPTKREQARARAAANRAAKEEEELFWRARSAALENLRTHRPSKIVVDSARPGARPIDKEKVAQFAAILRRDEQFKHPLIVLVTKHMSTDEVMAVSLLDGEHRLDAWKEVMGDEPILCTEVVKYFIPEGYFDDWDDAPSDTERARAERIAALEHERAGIEPNLMRAELTREQRAAAMLRDAEIKQALAPLLAEQEAERKAREPERRARREAQNAGYEAEHMAERAAVEREYQAPPVHGNNVTTGDVNQAEPEPEPEPEVITSGTAPEVIEPAPAGKRRGRPKKPGSVREQAAEAGVSRSTAARMLRKARGEEERPEPVEKLAPRPEVKQVSLYHPLAPESEAYMARLRRDPDLRAAELDDAARIVAQAADKCHAVDHVLFDWQRSLASIHWQTFSDRVVAWKAKAAEAAPVVEDAPAPVPAEDTPMALLGALERALGALVAPPDNADEISDRLEAIALDWRQKMRTWPTQGGE